MERRGSGSAGYVIVLLGVVTFVVGSFLPYWGDIEPTSASLSFYRLVIPEHLAQHEAWVGSSYCSEAWRRSR